MRRRVFLPICVLCINTSWCDAQSSPADVGKNASKPAVKSQPPVTKPSQKAIQSRLDVEPKVLTTEDAAKRSESLRSLTGEAGDDRYGKINWSQVPAWRQTTFFGVRAQGQTFIYVIDCSGSMADDLRMIRAKQELRRSILSLQFPQRFKVIGYNDQPLPMPGDLPKSADGPSKEQLLSWLRRIEPDGGTDPRLAVKMALSLRPDAVFLLSDGAFPAGAAKEIAQANRGRTPIHCVDLSDGAGGEQLKQIANASGGRYVVRP